MLRGDSHQDFFCQFLILEHFLVRKEYFCLLRVLRAQFFGKRGQLRQSVLLRSTKGSNLRRRVSLEICLGACICLWFIAVNPANGNSLRGRNAL